MKYWEQETSVLVQPEMAAADSTSIGVWMRILNYCAIQENGGRITNAATTLRSERALSATLGITRDELEHALEHSTIVFLDGTDLCILNYCHREQSTLEARRTGGKNGGRPRSETSRKPPENLPAQEVFSPETSPSREREGKVREGKVRDSSAQGAASSHSSIPVPAETSDDSWEGQQLANLKAADKIAAAYKKPGGSQAIAIAAIVRALEAGQDPAEMLRAVEAHERYRSALPRSNYHPGREKFFESEAWRCKPADVFQTPMSQDTVGEPEKNSAAPPVPERKGPAAPAEWQALYAEEMDVPPGAVPHDWHLVPSDLKRRLLLAAERRAAA